MLSHTSNWGILEHFQIRMLQDTHRLWLYIFYFGLYGLEVFSTPKAHAHCRIAWGVSPMVPQIPCARGVSGILHGIVCNIEVIECLDIKDHGLGEPKCTLAHWYNGFGNPTLKSL